MVHRRLMRLVKRHNILPESMLGFRQQRCTTDRIGDLALLLEEARRMGRMAHVAFLDTYHAFDALPHNIIV